MTNEEIIADERYHTCGRCKWEDIPFICHQCKWGEDVRKDLWQYKDSESEDNDYPLDMTTEQYRLRMIQAFHNADCDNLIALVVLPTEKEFEHLEWLLKTHYKTEPCEDCVSRQEFEKRIKPYDTDDKMDKALYNFAHNILISCTSVKPQRPKGKWIVLREEYEFMGSIVNEPRGCKCSNCNKVVRFKSDFCPNCGADMRGEE